MKKKKILTPKIIGKIIVAIIIIAAFIIIPLPGVVSRYMLKVYNDGLIYFIAALGLSVMLGMGGQVTYSTAGIMGVGAYITAILSTKYGWNTGLAIIVALIAGAIFSFVVGLALFRLKGSYFSFASIGLTNLLVTIFSNWMEMTEGPDGITRIPKLDVGFMKFTDFNSYFRLLFIIAIICYLFVLRLRKTSYGRALASVRDNEITAASFGVNCYMTKVYSFVIAGVFACLAGGLYAVHAGFISPEPFKYDQSAIYLIMIMLGGVDSTFGAFLGASLLTIIPEKMRWLNEYYKLIYGVGVIILMIFMPMGLMGIIDNFKYKIIGKIKKRKQSNAIETEAN
jgi:branched-chain amino acid transport system permease protein